MDGTIGNINFYLVAILDQAISPPSAASGETWPMDKPRCRRRNGHR